jgi:putative ABC transport system permease protein
VRQLLTESLIVALLGGLVGAILATWGVRVIRATPPEGLPRVEEIGVNLPVLAVTMGISLLTAIVVGLTPAIRAATPNILPSLKQGEGRAGTSPSRSRLRSALVVGQVALALVLLVGAGLLLRSFERLSHLNPGFNPTNVVTLDVFPPGQKYQDAASASRLYQRLEEAVAPLPGVQTVALSNHVPLSGAYYPSRVELPGRPPVAGEDESVLFRTISPTYFTAMQIPVVKGRPFAESDMTSTASIAIVNQAFVRKYWPTADPIGQPMTLFKSAQGRPDFGQPFGVTVVGVVGDVRHVGLQEEVDPEVYVPFTINPWGHMVLVIKTIPDPRVLVRTLQRAVLAVDPDIAVVGSSRSGGFISAEHYISRYLAVRRFSVLLLGGFAVCALVLAAVGIYGVISYNVAQRTREMGIRTALGAEARDVTALVVRQSMRRVLIGLGIGVAAAVALTRLMTALLYGVTATDPLTFMTVTLLLSLVALMASYMPARRASRVDPAAALRYE